MPYCLYLRKSRADLELEAKGELETLARHKKALIDLSKRLKLSVTEVYEEIVSGETIEARPVVRQLLDEVERGAWDGVLVMEVERLARGDTIDQGVVARAFKMGHAKIITPSKIYDPDNEFDEEYFEFGLFMSRREYKTINRRIQRGRVASAKEGKFVGSTPPYGYDKVRIAGDKGYTLALHPDESQVVELIFNMYVSGSGMGVIAGYLDSMGIKPRNRDTWSKSTISDILANPVYTGKLRWSYRVERKFMEGGKVEKRRIKNDAPIYVEGLHPAIVSEEQFENAQVVRGKNTIKKTKNSLSLQNPLSGLVYCRLCGSLMTRLGQNVRCKYATLRCSNRYCKNVSAPIFLVEKKIIESLKRLLVAYHLEMNLEDKATDVSLQQKALKGLQQGLEKIDLQIKNTYDLLEQGVYTIDVFTSRNRELAERKAALSVQIDNIEQIIYRVTNAKKVKLEQVPRMIEILDDYNFEDLAEKKNELLRELLVRVEYSKETPNTRGNLLNDNFQLVLSPRLQINNN